MADPTTYSDAERGLVERIIATAPALAEVRDIARRFMAILRHKNADALEA